MSIQYKMNLFLLFIFSSVWADQHVLQDKATSPAQTLTYGKDVILTDDQYQDIMKTLKTVAEGVETFLPIPVITEIAGMIAFCAETQIEDVSDKLKKVEKLITDGFTSMERSLANAVKTLRCDIAHTAYVDKHHDRAVEAEMLLINLVKLGKKALAEFKMECNAKGYVSDVRLLFTKVSKENNFGIMCLADENFSYTAMLNIIRIIKFDAFILSLNALNCQKALNGTIDLDLESSLLGIQHVFAQLIDAQTTRALPGLNNALLTYFHGQQFNSTVNLATQLVAMLNDYNNSRIDYMTGIVSKKARIDEATVIAPGYDRQVLEFKEVGEHSVSVYAANLTTESTRLHRQWLMEHQEMLKKALAMPRMTKYREMCPPAAEIAEELNRNYTMMPYVHVVTTPKTSDFFHYGDERICGYFTFNHSYKDYILNAKRTMTDHIRFRNGITRVPTKCVVHVVIGF
uniref:Venom protein n=1 Tax=Steinernema glaseri TaxID=37863 RepID=A0A1I8A7T0_9BILA